MNITGASNLSLFEVQEAAEIVSSASDPEVNMIFGSVINDDLNDELVVTVIATGFSEAGNRQVKPAFTRQAAPTRSEDKAEGTVAPSPVNEAPRREVDAASDDLDIPAFLRNRNRNR